MGDAGNAWDRDKDTTPKIEIGAEWSKLPSHLLWCVCSYCPTVTFLTPLHATFPYAASQAMLQSVSIDLEPYLHQAPVGACCWIMRGRVG